MSEKVKAYVVSITCEEWVLLVYAKNANRARSLFCNFYREIGVGDITRNEVYYAARAIRKKELDELFHDECYVEENSGLPDGIEFYNESYC